MTAAHVTGARSPRHRGARRGHHRLLWLPLVVFAAVASMAFIYVVYVLWPRWPGPPVGADAPALPITIAGVTFNVPPAAIRVPVQRRPGAQERLETLRIARRRAAAAVKINPRRAGTENPSPVFLFRVYGDRFPIGFHVRQSRVRSGTRECRSGSVLRGGDNHEERAWLSSAQVFGLQRSRSVASRWQWPQV